MTKKARVTMADVARVAHVTPQTVSRAFRSAPDISEETRQKVLQVAAELNYVMNDTASSLRGGHSRLIVVVYDNLVNIYFSIMIDYLQNSLRERGYSVLVLSVAEAMLSRAAYTIAVSHNAAGIVSFLEPDGEIEELVNHFSIPVLLLGRRTDIGNVDYLCTDDEEGGRLAARSLIGSGCKKLVFMSIPLEISCAYDRYHGFAEEAKALGLGQPVFLDAYATSVETLIERLFSGGEEVPDGIFCFNDMIAFDAIYNILLKELPRIRIVGYDCVTQEVHIPYRLYSIGTDKRALAERAAELIIHRIEHRDAPRAEEKAEVRLLAGQAGDAAI